MTGQHHDELLDHARRIIRDLRARLTAAEAQSRPEPIAIVGMAFRFPGAGSDPERLWTMFAEGRDAVGPVPSDRWSAEDCLAADPSSGKIPAARGAFLDEVRRFDAGFFDITPREAVRMDPQQRLFLETAWHALEDAGLPRERIAGSETGVFVGIHNHSSDYRAMQFESPETLDAWSATGTAHDMIAGRLAYWLDLHGPAVAVNTACSSSLAAVHVACRSLRAGDCTTAVAAGANLLLSPKSMIAATQLQLLSPDGHCRTFDARAEGMGRGEGVGVVVLKKLSAAQQAGDRVLAVIRGSAMNQDGRTNGLTAPNGLAQQRVIQRALAEAGVQPAEVGYVETHGTGTALGDPIEVEAIAAVFRAGARPAPCTLGAAKANLGHLEGAAGIAGLIKAVMVLRHRWMPPVANLRELNPHLAMEGAQLEIPRIGRSWPSEQPRMAGVSSFGWSGTNVHVVLEEAPAVDVRSAGSGRWPVVISAQTPEALRQLAEAFAERLDSSRDVELPAMSYTSTVRRTAHRCRIAVEGTQPQEIARQLRQWLADPKVGSRETKKDERLARWASGGDVDWSAWFPEPLHVVDLPHYPFQGREYWIEDKPAVHSSSPAAVQASRSRMPDGSAAPGDWFYQVGRVEKDLNVRLKRNARDRAAWILLGRATGLSRQMASVVRSRGEELGFASPASLAEMLSRCRGTGPRYVVCFPEQDEPSAVTAEALGVVQAFLGCEGSARLWFVSERPPGAVLDEGVSSALNSFTRVAGLEHPNRVGGVIVADAGSAAQVCDEMDGDAGEDSVLLREGRRWVPRLRRERLQGNGSVPIREDRSYLITGAFGAIGMDVAAWLIGAGARHLLLAGRRDPSAMGKPQMLAQMDAWRAKGIEIRNGVCDVADEAQVAALLAETDAGGAPLAGVVHAAAGVRFSPVEAASAEEVRTVFRAKVEGARVLDRCTRARALDFFVLFSSAAATLGLRNGAIYAAANSALHDVVEERRALGLPALCVEWGSWVSTHTGAQRALIENSGFLAMPPQSALAGLAALMQEGRSRGLVADVDWRILGSALALRGRDALVSTVFRENDEPARGNGAVEAAAWIESLRALSPVEQHEQLLNLIATEARGIFGMAPEDPLQEDRGLFAMGMDSLMAVRLKRRLEERTGLRLPGTVTLTYPTLAGLAEYLQTRLFGDGAVITPAPARTVPDGELTKVAVMNDDETRAALEEELAAVQQTLAREAR
ncbi:MAG TPA: SDR family NAD(P)-dependent oxidoreductase [Acidobacteriaceae bacterium]|jgi:acyl transferase domain-containing protein/acyl carrier protein|nr:SDR family NAD(P)-dependent oxidoreductase [Acidobacteriaceae bacterium]